MFLVDFETSVYPKMDPPRFHQKVIWREKNPLPEVIFSLGDFAMIAICSGDVI